MTPELRRKVHARSGGRCEVMVNLVDMGWFRCDSEATDIHHMLPRSRGGNILDDWGEIDHLIHLCRTDHNMAHSRKHAEGMMIDGSVTWDKLNHRPIYQGKEMNLKRKYGPTSG